LIDAEWENHSQGDRLEKTPTNEAEPIHCSIVRAPAKDFSSNSKRPGVRTGAAVFSRRGTQRILSMSAARLVTLECDRTSLFVNLYERRQKRS